MNKREEICWIWINCQCLPTAWHSEQNPICWNLKNFGVCLFRYQLKLCVRGLIGYYSYTKLSSGLHWNRCTWRPKMTMWDNSEFASIPERNAKQAALFVSGSTGDTKVVTLISRINLLTWHSVICVHFLKRKYSRSYRFRQQCLFQFKKGFFTHVYTLFFVLFTSNTSSLVIKM